jgi:hypothetical protein
MIRRRELVAGLAGAASMWALLARAQQPTNNDPRSKIELRWAEGQYE